MQKDKYKLKRPHTLNISILNGVLHLCPLRKNLGKDIKRIPILELQIT